MVQLLHIKRMSWQTTQLVADTKNLTDAIKAGDIEKAKALYAPTRQHYERIEPIAELFSRMAVLTPVKMITSKSRRSKNSPVSTVWKKHCLATTPPKGWIKCTDQLYTDVVDFQSASVNWLSHLQKWSAVQPD